MDTHQYCIGKYEHAFAEHIGGSVVRYTWKCGHQSEETLMVGPKGRGSRGLRKPMSVEAVKILARHWGQKHDDGSPMYTFAAGPCPKCVRLASQRDPNLVKHLKPRRSSVRRHTD